MITEIFGLPGSGKTTLARQLVEKHGLKIIRTSNKAELLFFNLLYLIKHPINFIVTLTYIIINSCSWPMFYYKFMNFFLDTNARYQKASRYQKAILDQGYFQNVLSVFEKELDPKSLRRYCQFLFKPDKLIILDTPHHETLRRAELRGRYSRERFGQDYVARWQKIILANFNLFKSEIKNYDVSYTIVNNTDNPDLGLMRLPKVEAK